jgi:hypothetical protein
LVVGLGIAAVVVGLGIVTAVGDKLPCHVRLLEEDKWAVEVVVHRQHQGQTNQGNFGGGDNPTCFSLSFDSPVVSHSPFVSYNLPCDKDVEFVTARHG